MPIFSEAQTCPSIKDAIGNENVTIGCGYPLSSNGCATLKVDFPAINYTGTYNDAQKITYAPLGSLNQGTPIGIYEDDKFIKKIDFSTLGNIPFMFSFYGKIYDSVLVSSNGFITFDNNLNEGDFSTADIVGQTIPSTYLPKSSVFGVFQDLNFKGQNGAEIYYRVEGKAPCRKLIINFYKGVITGTNQVVSSQIVLHEFTNIVDVFVENKPIADASAKVKEALIGITDEFGNGISPTNRNTGVWAANKEGYRFTPSGNSINPSRIIWSGSSTQALPTCFNLNHCETPICSTKDETILATAYYNLPDGSILKYSDDIDVTFEADFPKAKDFIKIICDGSSTTYLQSDINPDLTIHGTAISSFVFKYYTNYADALNGNSNFLNSSLLLDLTQKYFVRIESKANPKCFTISNFSFATVSNSILKNSVEICDANNDGFENNFTLSKLNCQLFSSSFKPLKIEYLINNVPVTTANITSSTVLYVRVTTPDCGVKTYGPIIVQFTSAPSIISSPITFTSENEICDIITNDNRQFIEPFEWEKEMKDRGIVFTNDTNVVKTKFYLTENNAKNDVGELTTIKEGLLANDYTYDMFARVEYSEQDCKGACYSVVKFSAKVKFSNIILNVTDNDADSVADSPLIFDTENADVYICYNGNFSSNLKDEAEKIIKLVSPISGVTITYHETYQEANDDTNTGLTNLDITIPNNVITKTYLVRYALGKDCYVVKPLVYHIILPNAEKKNIEVCTNDINVPVAVTLSLYNKTILGSQATQNPPPTVIYYDQDPVTNPSANVITTLLVSKTPIIIYAKVISNLVGVCDKVHPIEFKLVAIEGIIAEKVPIKITCDNLNDGVEYINLKDYEKNIVNDPSQYIFTYYYGYSASQNTFNTQITSNLTNFKVNKNVTIYVKISRTGTECYRKAELNITFDIQSIPQIKLNSAVLIACSSSQTVTFNLEKSITQLYDISNPDFATFITSVRYYEKESDAIAGNNNNIVNYTNYNLFSTTPTKIIYARYDSSYGCYNVAPIKLRIIDSLKFKNNISHTLCDDNLDGKYTFDLRTWLDSITKDTDANNDLLTDSEVNQAAIYSFYRSIGDMNAGIKLDASQEKNYTVNPQNPIVIIKAEIDLCSTYQIINFVLNPSKPTQYFVIDDICDAGNDGIETMDLTQFESQMKVTDETFKYYNSLADLYGGSNEISSPSVFTANINITKKVYVKVSSSTDCPWLAEISLTLNPVPDFKIPNYYVCPGQALHNLSPNFSAYHIVSYEWQDAQGNVISTTDTASTLPAGKYKLKVTTNKGCIYITTFEVIEKEVPIIEKLIAQNNSYTVIASGSKKIFYSTEGINWQESNVFNSLPVGRVTFYVKFEGENCIGETREGIILKIINSFSPNGDGVNDIWEVEVTHNVGDKAILKIYDRYGVLIYEQEESDKVFWNGTSKGRKVITDTYWYHLELADGRHYEGYIFLKNRE